MSDFVTAIKPKAHSSVPAQDDFVAEIRSRSSHPTSTNQAQGLGSSCNDSDMYLQKMLSGEKISRQGLTRLLEGSLVTLVETLLTGRNISRIEGTLCISFCGHESPVVVNLHKTFPKISNSQRSAELVLENCLNVKVKPRDTSVLSSSCDHPVMYCSPPDEFDRDPCHSPPETDRGLSASAGSQDERVSIASTCVPNSSPPSPVNNSISSTTGVATVSSITRKGSSASSSPKPDAKADEIPHGYPVNESPKNRDSDGESGYLSNDKEDLEHANDNRKDGKLRCLEKSVAGFNDYFCSGFDGADVGYMSMESPGSDDSCSKQDPDSCGASVEGSDDMIDDSGEDCEHQLVIDEHALHDLKTAQLDEKFDDDDHRRNCCSPPEKVPVVNDAMDVNPVQQPLDEEEEEDSMTVECDDVESSVGLVMAGTNTHVELPGNSRFSGDDVSSSQQPQGIVSRLHTEQPQSIVSRLHTEQPQSIVSRLHTEQPQSIVSRHAGGFMCQPCRYILPDTTSATLHVQSEHDLHLCTYCCRTFTAKSNLKRHVRCHTGQKPYKCHNCPQSFFRPDDLKGHMIRHEYNKPFRCALRQKGYTDQACVKNHMAKEHKSGLMYVCPQCDQRFECERSFADHKGTHPELQQFACSTCSYIGTNDLMALKHNLLHSHKLFSCRPCNAHFADPFHYTSHVRKHKHTDSFTEYVCCFCDRVLATYHQYVRHEYSHAQCKIHACTICRKQFRSKLLLLDHTMTHQQPVQITTRQHLSKTIEMERPHWDGKQKHFREADVNLQPASVVFTSQRSHCDVENTSSGAIQMEHDEFYGQLLDLSMKKSSNPAFINDSFNNEQNQADSYNTSVRAKCASVNDGPRNGTRSTEPACLSPECGLTASGFAFSRSVKDVATDESTYTRRLSHVTHSTRRTDFGIYRRQLSPDSDGEPRPFVNGTDRYALSEMSRAGQSRHDERAHLSGGLNDERAHISGKLNDERGHISGKLNDERAHLSGGLNDERAHISGGLNDERAHISGGLNDERAHISGGLNDERAHISGKLNDERAHISGKLNDERAHISGRPNVPDKKLWQPTGASRPSSRQPLLFRPYNRDRMADLAAKFMLARGGKLTEEKGKVKFIVKEEKKAGGIREQSIAQKQQTPSLTASGASPMEPRASCKNVLLGLTGQARQGHDNVVSEYSNLETTLSCHIPTVVKSEPLKELDENAGSPMDCRYRALKAEVDGRMSSAVGSQSCDICREMFATFLELEDHSVEVHKRYLCEHCKKGFTARPNRDRHVRYHTGERPYKCDLCDLAFFRGDDLKYHRTTRHPTAQPYVCPRCSAPFTWGRDLERHIRHSKCKV